MLIRGTAGGRLPIIVVAAILGAWAGDALADRLGFDVLTIGDFHLLGRIDRGLGRDRRLDRGRDPRPVGASGMTRRSDDLTTATFLRGLTLGAILGAIIAGSSIWSRRFRRRSSRRLALGRVSRPSRACGSC